MIPTAKIALLKGTSEFTLSPNNGSRGGVVFSIPGIAGTAVRDDLCRDVTPPLWIAESEVGLFEPVRLREQTEYDFTVTVMGTETSIKQSRTSNPVYPFRAEKLSACLSFNGEDACATLPDGRYRLTGRLNFGGYAGKADLSLVSDFGIELLVDVVSTKIGYETEFQRLLEQLADIHAELILNMDGATEVALATDPANVATDQMQVFHLRRLFQDSVLPQSLAAILSQPHFRYNARQRNDPIAFVTDPDMLTITSNFSECLWNGGGPLERVFRGFTPEFLPTHAVEKSYDTPENRFVKTALRHLQSRIVDLSLRIPTRYLATRTALNGWGQELESILQHPLWNDVANSHTSPNSMVLQQRHGYRDFLRDVLAFEFGLRLNTSLGEYDSTSGDLKPVHEMYELWCYFQLRRMLDEICHNEGSPSLQHNIIEGEYKIDLKKGKNSAVRYEITHLSKPITINFYYNRTFSRVEEATKLWSESYTALFHPDFSLEIIGNGVPHWVHFDAKYKLDIAQWRGAIDSVVKNEHAYNTEDLQRMHSYRDALLGTRASFILYPSLATEPEVFVRQIDSIYRKSFLGPSVGAFGLSPATGGHPDVSELGRFVTQIVGAVAASTGYSEEEGFH